MAEQTGTREETPPAETFQLTPAQAEAYDAEFVPAIFAGWVGPVLDAAGVGPGDRVLDVGCGTGVACRGAAERVGRSGRVVGVDLSEAMLAVARKRSPGLDLRRGDAAALPVADGAVDAVVSQFALMFVPDPARAVSEMARVTRPGGTVTVMVPAAVGEQPVFGPFVEAVGRHAGPSAVRMVSAYWALGDVDTLHGLLVGAGLDRVVHRTLSRDVRYPDVEAMVRTEVASTPLADRLTDAEFAALLGDCRTRLAGFATARGFVAPLVGHVVTGTRP